MNKALDHLNPRDALRMHLCCNEKTKKQIWIKAFKQSWPFHWNSNDFITYFTNI